MCKLMSEKIFVHQYHDLITLFYNCFGVEFNTRLIKGDNEPIYLPADEQRLIMLYILLMVFLAVHCMNVLTGLLLVKSVESKLILDIGICRMDVP